MSSVGSFVKNIFFVFMVLSISWFLTYNALALITWSVPLSGPVNSGIGEPINGGTGFQEKAGNLQVKTLSVEASSGVALLVPNGNIGIGALTPTAKVEILSDTRVSAGACTVTKGVDVMSFELTIGGAGCTFDSLGIGEGSQIIVNTGGYYDPRIVTARIPANCTSNCTKVAINEGVTWWSGEVFEYVKTQGIKVSDAAFTTNGMVIIGGGYEGPGGVTIPNMNMVVGGGSDSIFHFRFRNVIAGGHTNTFIFQGEGPNGTPIPLSVSNDSETVGIGAFMSDPAGALDIYSTTGGLVVPRMTTAQRDLLTPVNGMIIYNTDSVPPALNFRENGAWVLK